MGDDLAVAVAEAEGAARVDEIPDDWESIHQLLINMAEERGDYCGVPIPLDGFSLTLQPRHKLRETMHEVFDLTAEGKERAERRRRRMLEALGMDEDVEPSYSYVCSSSDIDDTEWVRNAWWSKRLQRTVYLVEKGKKVSAQLGRRAPMSRLTMWVESCGVSAAWRVEAEREALTKLRELIPDHLGDMYELTGAFMETSSRSGVTYLFRKNRPTVALVPSDRHNNDAPMKVLAALCMHPIGYYNGTWSGAMVPTDDVIAHLVMMRGDEHMFWRRCNQHTMDAPEAGV